MGQSQNGGRQLLGKPEAKPDGPKNGDHPKYAENQQKGNLQWFLQLLKLGVLLKSLGYPFQLGQQPLSDAFRSDKVALLPPVQRLHADDIIRIISGPEKRAKRVFGHVFPVDALARLLPTLRKSAGGIPVAFLLLRRNDAQQGQAVFLLLGAEQGVDGIPRPCDVPLGRFFYDGVGSGTQAFRCGCIKTLPHIQRSLKRAFRLPGEPIVHAGGDHPVRCQKHDHGGDQRKGNENDDETGTDLRAEDFPPPLHDQLDHIARHQKKHDQHENGIDVQQGDEHP